VVGMCTPPVAGRLRRIVVSGTTISGYSCSCVDIVGQLGHRPSERRVPCTRLLPLGGEEESRTCTTSIVVSWSVVMRLGWPCPHLYSLCFRAGRLIEIAPRSLVPAPWAV
jgi:hypothetical protein